MENLQNDQDQEELTRRISNLLKKIECLEEENHIKEQMVLVIINCFIYGFAFYSFTVVSAWAWVGFHQANTLITQTMLLKQAMLYIFTVIVTVGLWLRWWEAAIAPILDDATIGFGRIRKWVDGAIRGGRKALETNHD